MLRRIRVALLAVVAVVGVAGLAVAAPVADKGGRPHPAKTDSSATDVAKPSKPPKQSGAQKQTGAPKSDHGKGPDATGPAAHGLCNAWSHSTKHGKSLHHSVAMRNLARAAVGYDKIGAYCAKLPARAKNTEPDEPEPSETD